MNGWQMAAVLVLAAWCMFWIIREDRRSRRRKAFDQHAGQAILIITVDTSGFEEGVRKAQAAADRFDRTLEEIHDLPEAGERQ